MANDHYVDDDQGNWALLEEEFRECQLFIDVSDLIVSKGYNYVLSNILKMIDDREHN